MFAPEAVEERVHARPPFAGPSRSALSAPAHPALVPALAWAVLASTLHRIRRGEGVLLAINLSLIAYHAPGVARGVAEAVVSALAILVMYAFNDLYDAPADWNNPKKDRALVAVYHERRRAGVITTIALKVLTLLVALTALGPGPTAAVASVMIVNVAYSMAFKGTPVIDLACVWLWGTLYAAIIGGPVSLLVLVGLMTAICHLFQALDDRVPDAANGIQTTAVRSTALARITLVVLSSLLFVNIQPAIGTALACTAFIPLGLSFVVATPATAWILTKVYFGVLWLSLLGSTVATG